MAIRNSDLSYLPEIYRLHGQAIAGRSSNAADTATAHYQKGLNLAREHGAKFWELRTAVSLGRLWYGQGKTVQARELVEPVYCWFTEGFDTGDLRDAKALLEEL